MNRDRIVAVALLTEENLGTFGSCLKQVFPVQDAGKFDDLIKALEEADRRDRVEPHRI